MLSQPVLTRRTASPPRRETCRSRSGCCRSALRGVRGYDRKRQPSLRCSRGEEVMPRSPLIVLFPAVLLAGAGAAEEPSPVVEAFKAQISLKSASGPRISPDGSLIAFTVTSTDWENNRFDREIWLAPADGEPFPLTGRRTGTAAGSGGRRTGPGSGSSRTAVTERRSTSSARKAARPSSSPPTRAGSTPSASRWTAPGSRSSPPIPLPTASRSVRRPTATTPSRTPTSAWPTYGWPTSAREPSRAG